MHLPAQLSLISADKNWTHLTPYPPLGFVPFSENALGNGDTFGLYWPIGRETSEPIVVETLHDCWRIQPAFSSLAVFLETVALDPDEYPEPPTIDEDPNSPNALLIAAKEAVQQQEVEAAISHLEKAITILPEYTEALSLLWGQYVRVGRKEDATQIALRAIISPPCFGDRPVKALRWLCSPLAASTLVQDDPIWQARNELKLAFGGKKGREKESADFPVLLNAINTYITQSKLIQASTLMQTYAELMSAETVAFRERYGFNLSEFIAWQIETSAKQTTGSRAVQL